MSSVLVTGGAGFIGSHLVEGLLEKGHEVRVLDNLSTAHGDDVISKAEFIKGSITDKGKIRESLKGVQCVFHLAAIGSVQASIQKPSLSHDVNVVGTLNLVESSLALGVDRIVYASSCAVYGDLGRVPITEDSAPQPKSLYAATKLAPEFYLEAFNKQNGLESISLRYFNVYGPRQNPDLEYSAVIPIFIKSLLKGERPTIFGDGEQSRDFVFVKDVVEANVMAMDTKVKFAILNIGSGVSTSINALTSTLNNILGKDIEPRHSDPRKGDIRHSLADISKAKAVMGYEPGFKLEDGLELTVEHIKEEIK